MSPTPAGEGKSTTTVGLADSLARAGHKVMIALREPSLGPILGMKGGATGGGYSQVLPMDQINLHFTGDFHAITSANNALMALVDNHIFQGNELNIDPRRMTFKRVLDMNDRSLREVVIGLGGPAQGTPRQDGFDITVASEIMAVFCLATDLNDLRERLGRITFGYTYDRQPVTVADLGVQGALTMLLKDAIKPNLVQTIAGTPALVHGGPFANIAHGCNSLIATQTARSLADIVVTEAGFGADLGAEKYMDIKSRIADVAPSAVVLVATVRALKMHGGVPKDRLTEPNVEALAAGVANLQRHIRNVEKFGIIPVVAINKFATDTAEELDWLLEWCAAEGVQAAVADVWGRGGGGDGGDELAAKVAAAIDAPHGFRHLYPLDMSVEDKIRTIVQEVYGADGVDFSVPALKRLAEIEKNGWSGMPVCMAKTQYSFSDDATRLGAPKGFTDPRPGPHPQDRRRLYRGPHRRGHDHAGPAQGPGSDADGRRRRRQPRRPLLDPPPRPSRCAITSGLPFRPRLTAPELIAQPAGPVDNRSGDPAVRTRMVRMHPPAPLPVHLSAAPFTVSEARAASLSRPGSGHSDLSISRPVLYRPAGWTSSSRPGPCAVRRVAGGLDLAPHGRRASGAVSRPWFSGSEELHLSKPQGAAAGPAQGHGRAYGSGVRRRGHDLWTASGFQHPPGRGWTSPAIAAAGRFGLHGRRARSDAPPGSGGTNEPFATIDGLRRW